jgi:methylated-DNA-[protein]-cysteine S-methyltransferase
MRTNRNAAVEHFAGATDALAQNAPPPGGLDPEMDALVSLARRLRDDAGGAMPDPAFMDGLRAELRLQAVGRGTAAASTLAWSTLETPIGLLGVVHRNGLVLYCNRVGDAAGFARAAASRLGELPRREAALPEKLAGGILDHLAGRRRFRGVDLSWLPPFQRRVLEKTADIPRGEVRPYGWVAREIGSPGATRAVGTALGHNPIPFIIPCHRVVRSDGSLGEYSGGGPEAKVRVLEYEGAPVEQLLQLAGHGDRFTGSRTTHIVCYPSCHAARRTRPENGVVFNSLLQAEDRGYRPCKLCRPA